jgi:hypothetical protein
MTLSTYRDGNWWLAAEAAGPVADGPGPLQIYRLGGARRTP